MTVDRDMLQLVWDEIGCSMLLPKESTLSTCSYMWKTLTLGFCIMFCPFPPNHRLITVILLCFCKEHITEALKCSLCLVHMWMWGLLSVTPQNFGVCSPQFGNHFPDLCLMNKQLTLKFQSSVLLGMLKEN